MYVYTCIYMYTHTTLHHKRHNRNSSSSMSRPSDTIIRDKSAPSTSQPAGHISMSMCAYKVYNYSHAKVTRYD